MRVVLDLLLKYLHLSLHLGILLPMLLLDLLSLLEVLREIVLGLIIPLRSRNRFPLFARLFFFGYIALGRQHSGGFLEGIEKWAGSVESGSSQQLSLIDVGKYRFIHFLGSFLPLTRLATGSLF